MTEKGTFLFRDREIDLRIVFQFDVDRFKINQHAEYQG